MKLLLFDVDLTLISTGGAGLRALNRACRKILSIDNAMDGIIPSGKTDPSIVREIFARRCLSESLCSFEDIIVLYLTLLKEEVENTTLYQVMPGIYGILEELSARSDVLLGLATGNVEAGARIKLERGNLNSYFRFGGFGSDAENRTELVRRAVEMAAVEYGGKVSSSDVFVIGDTPLDVEAGRQAGFHTVGVATGRHSIDDLRQAGAELAIADFECGRDQFLRTTFME